MIRLILGTESPLSRETMIGQSTPSSAPRFYLAAAAAIMLAFCVPNATAQDAAPSGSEGEVPSRDATVPQAPQSSPEPGMDGDIGYYDEPPLDFYERNWRWFTRHVQPQRFAGRDARRRYGYGPPFDRRWAYPQWGWGAGGYMRPYGYHGYGSPYGYANEGEAYIQGRRDERRFRDWRDRYDKGRSAFKAAMADGIRLFRDADYQESLRAFVRAAKLNQGDPASRVHATYALVAVGNYDDAVLMIRRAIQLQSDLLYLPLNIREEYGPKVDFDAHLQRLDQAAQQAGDDPGLYMLLGYYHLFSGDSGKALAALSKAVEIAPRDPIILDLHEAARLTTLTPAAP